MGEKNQGAYTTPMNSTYHDSEVVHHRLLEGAILRLARIPDADDFVLRGGMLLRLWFRPLLRSVGDLDLVARYPFDVEETGRRFLSLLEDRSVDDGVVFHEDRARAEGIWLNSNFPAVRIYASGEVEGIEGDLAVDVTFGEPLLPEPYVGDYPMQGCELTARLWMCRPETILGRKLHALIHMGRRHWRPKDLNDIRLLLRLVPLDNAAIPEAIVTSFTSREDPPELARSVFRLDWWTRKMSAARWEDFARRSRSLEVPGDLTQVVEEIGSHLNPILEQLP